MVSEKLTEYILHREEEECEIAVCRYNKEERVNLFINLVKLAEAIAVGANDLSLILPCGVGPQSRSSLPHKSCSVTFRTPIHTTDLLKFGLLHRLRVLLYVSISQIKTHTISYNRGFS